MLRCTAAFEIVVGRRSVRHASKAYRTRLDSEAHSIAFIQLAQNTQICMYEQLTQLGQTDPASPMHNLRFTLETD